MYRGPARCVLTCSRSIRIDKKTKLSQPGTQLATPGGAIGSVCVQGAAGPYADIAARSVARNRRCSLKLP
jgi:hypothetical protein